MAIKDIKERNELWLKLQLDQDLHGPWSNSDQLDLIVRLIVYQCLREKELDVEHTMEHLKDRVNYVISTMDG